MTLSSKLRAISSAALVGLSALASPQIVLAQTAAPKPEAILARHVEALGGESALSSVNSMHQSLSMEMGSMGITAQVEVFVAKPKRMMMRNIIPGLGEILTGTDGTIAWAVDPMQGPRLLQGAELDQAIAQSDFSANLLMKPESFSKIEPVAGKDFAGQSTYGLALTSKATGKATTYYFSKENGLLLATEVVQEGPAGVIPVTTVFSAYKTFSGLKFATHTEISAGPNKIVTTVNVIELNKVTDSVFEFPDAIKALIKK